MSAPFFLVEVTPGETLAGVNAKPRADHAHHKGRVKAHGRTKSPTGVAADRCANEGEELSHTKWTSAVWDWYTLGRLCYGVFGVELGARPRRQEKAHEPKERAPPPESLRHHTHMQVARIEDPGKDPEQDRGIRRRLQPGPKPGPNRRVSPHQGNSKYEAHDDVSDHRRALHHLIGQARLERV